MDLTKYLGEEALWEVLQPVAMVLRSVIADKVGVEDRSAETPNVFINFIHLSRSQ